MSLLDPLLVRLKQKRRTVDMPPADAALGERFRGRVVHDCACGAAVDEGALLYAPEETALCPLGNLRFTTDYRVAALARELDARTRALFGRALRLRSVSAGSCGGCEAELVALGNVVFDLARFGVQFVASPRHADGIVITGAVNANMVDALRRTWEATPEPRIVIAVGACARDGGPFKDGDCGTRGVPADIPVDLWVPGCPPHPLALLDGVLRLLGRLPGR